MGLLSKQKAERKKYIYPTDFINLIAFTSNEVVEDVVSYLINNDFEQKVNSYHIDGHLRITQNDHNDKFGFDLNTRKFLDECYVSSFFTKYVSYDAMLKIDSNFYYLIDEIQSIDCIKELNLNFSSINEVRKAVNVWNKEIDNPIYRNDKGSFDQPNYCQSKLIKQNTFSVIEAACLLAGTSKEYIEQYTGHPRFIELYSDYISYKLMIELAIENDELYFLNGTIDTVILQKYLFNAGYIIKGFNDWLTIEPAKPLIGNKPNEQLEASNNELNEAQIKIADLESQLAQAKAELADKPANNITQSNTDIHNIKKEAIKQFNRSLATVLIDLDYKGKLRKSDIANYIMPYMKELAFVLADEQQDKANNLAVTYDTLYDNHLTNLGFKQGRQSDDEKQKVNIDLLFKKQLPITE
jgi:hypothetical protein